MFIFLLLKFESTLYIQDTSPLSDVWFASVFSQSVVCLFVLLICTHSFHTWLPYFLARILGTVDVMLSRDDKAAKHSRNCSMEFVLDTGAERWARRGLFGTRYSEPFSVPKERDAAAVFISGWHLETQLAISSQCTLWGECVFLAHG